MTKRETFCDQLSTWLWFTVIDEYCLNINHFGFLGVFYLFLYASSLTSKVKSSIFLHCRLKTLVLRLNSWMKKNKIYRSFFRKLNKRYLERIIIINRLYHLIIKTYCILFKVRDCNEKKKRLMRMLRNGKGKGIETGSEQNASPDKKRQPAIKLFGLFQTFSSYHTKNFYF